MEGEGNATVSAEFNFAVDPEAAFVTLSSYTCPIYVMPWEVSVKHAISYVCTFRIHVISFSILRIYQIHEADREVIYFGCNNMPEF